FCLALSPATAEPTTRFMVLVSVAVAPLSANSAANGNEAPGVLEVLPNTEALMVELPSLPWRWMPALPQLVIVLFWISTVTEPLPAERTKMPSELEPVLPTRVLPEMVPLIVPL